MKLLHPILWAIFAFFAIARLGVDSAHPDFSLTGLFKTAAHAYTFGLIGYAIGARDWIPAAIAGVLTLVEVAAFIVGDHE